MGPLLIAEHPQQLRPTKALTRLDTSYILAHRSIDALLARKKTAMASLAAACRATARLSTSSRAVAARSTSSFP